MNRHVFGWIAGMMILASTPCAHAQFAVIDVGAITQLVQQVSTLREQLETARDQLTQAQREYESMTGGRGMERILAGTVRNYLPPDWAALESAIRQQGVLGSEINAITTANAVLSAEFLTTLSPEVRAQLEAARRTAALHQVLSRRALQNTSERFSSLQQLIDAIGDARDQKAALDLQARTLGEVAMIGNDSAKLIVTFEAARAEELARQQRVREQAIADIGSLRRSPPLGL